MDMDLITCAVLLLVINFGGGTNAQGHKSCKDLEPPSETNKKAYCVGRICEIKCAVGFISNSPVYPRLNCLTKKEILRDKNNKLIEVEPKHKFGLFECRELISCGGTTNYPSIENSEITYQVDSNSYRVKCKPSYFSHTGQPDTTLTCSNNKWGYESGVLTCLNEPNCPPPNEIADGTIYGCRRDFYEDLGIGIPTTCFFQCKKRFLHHGPRKIVCDFNGGWNGADPTTVLPFCIKHPRGFSCDDVEDSCPNWKVKCGYNNQIVGCKSGTTGEKDTCYCTDDPEFDYLKDVYLNPPKCDQCGKTGLKCKEGQIWGCKGTYPVDLENCKCIPIKVHGRCERLKNIVMYKKFKEELATPDERFTGNASCKTDTKKTMTCTFSCAEGSLFQGNPTMTCDMNGKIIGDIPSCRAKDSCKNPPLRHGQIAKCDGSHCIITCRDGFVKENLYSAVYNCDTKLSKNGTVRTISHPFPLKPPTNFNCEQNDTASCHKSHLLFRTYRNETVFFGCRETPTCGKLLPTILPEAKLLYWELNGNKYVYKCLPGYYSGKKYKNIIDCDNYNWDFQIKCLKMKRCSKPPEIKNGIIYGCRADSLEEQKKDIISTCFVKCHNNFMHQYSRKIVCDHATGKWKGNSNSRNYPECIEYIENTGCSVKIIPDACKRKSFICEQSDQSVTCDNGKNCFCKDVRNQDYTPKDIYLNRPSCDWCEDALGPCKRNKTYTCSDVDDYENCKCVTQQVNEYCIGNKKLIEKAFTDGVVNCKTQKRRKSLICDFTCNDGYYREGPRKWKCDIYGKSTQRITSCKPLQCTNIEKDAQLLFSCWKTRDGVVKCRFGCKDDPYFTLDGSKYDECDGYKWKEGKPPKCKFTCKELKKPELFTCKNNKIAQMYTCTIKCKYPYEIHGSKEINCFGDDGWSNEEPECKKWYEESCQDAEQTYCDKIYRSRCKGFHMGKCTTEGKEPYKIDCGCQIPDRSWSCPFRELNQTKGVDCKVDTQSKLWTCKVQCFPDDQDRDNITKTFTCQKNLAWSVIDKCADFWKQKPCSEAKKKYCRELHYDGNFCTTEEKSPYRIDCGRKHPRRHWECPYEKFLDGEDRQCEKDVFHTVHGKHTLECNFPCTPGDTQRGQGSKSYTCHKGKWWGPEDRCFKCMGVKEGKTGKCSEKENPCKGIGDSKPICLSLHKGRVSGQVQTCQCQCYPLDQNSCSKMKCLSGGKPFCYFAFYPILRQPICQCMENVRDSSIIVESYRRLSGK